ncbi:hypothetical protein [Micromonospora sp. CPCC 205561]|uniref:hypothetical protein n=1 Tax=Micromonospora sp. CPCC 205561 TaxID=3122407 RepID=UPI002FEEAD24
MAIVVVGPPAAGKSTVAGVLAARRGLEVACFDEDPPRWYGKFGYTEQAADDAYASGGLSAWHAYTARHEVRALAEAVTATEGVVDTGGGVALQRGGSIEERMLRSALDRADFAVLVCPHPEDPDQAADVLAQRLLSREPGGVPGDWHQPDGVALLQGLIRASLALKESVDLLIDTANGELHERHRLRPATSEVI